ncbi:MAG TPA: hypothetical protein VF089_15765 [Candidatus Binatia bacterium]
MRTLDGFELAEPALFAKNAAMGRDLEALFTEFRGLIPSGADVGRVRDHYEKLDAGLLQAMEVLGGQPGKAAPSPSSMRH